MGEEDNFMWPVDDSRGEAPADELFMPIMVGLHKKYERAIPFSLLNAKQARKNHGQSLLTLKERGGVSAEEALAIIEGRRWADMSEAKPTALRRLNKLIDIHCAKNALPERPLVAVIEEYIDSFEENDELVARVMRIMSRDLSESARVEIKKLLNEAETG